MKLVESKFRALATERKTGAVHVQNGIVQVPLGICELAVGWPSSCNIGDVASELLSLSQFEISKMDG